MKDLTMESPLQQLIQHVSFDEISLSNINKLNQAITSWSLKSGEASCDLVKFCSHRATTPCWANAMRQTFHFQQVVSLCWNSSYTEIPPVIEIGQMSIKIWGICIDESGGHSKTRPYCPSQLRPFIHGWEESWHSFIHNMQFKISPINEQKLKWLTIVRRSQVTCWVEEWFLILTCKILHKDIYKMYAKEDWRSLVFVHHLLLEGKTDKGCLKDIRQVVDINNLY